MDILYDPKETERVSSARDSYSGRLLSDPDFDEAMMITCIMEKEIQKTARFAEKVIEYAAAYAHTRKNLSVVKAEKIIRDLFKERTGMSMNEMKEIFVQREEGLTDIQKRAAFPYASEIGPMIEKGDKISFHRAFSHQAKNCAMELNITDLGAKRIMSEQFEAVKGEKLYDWGKDQETRFYKPQIEAEKQERKTQRSQNRTHEYSRS
ncbi:MAG: hypothetical protein GY748_24350 [Planctomycetaceae bacterium]|nr:hypothetical protein [Planctomycetaceae bacterium]